jgi:hypothetical protein
MCSLPQGTSSDGRIDNGLIPLSTFAIAVTHFGGAPDELIADVAAKRLNESKMISPIAG